MRRSTVLTVLLVALQLMLILQSGSTATVVRAYRSYNADEDGDDAAAAADTEPTKVQRPGAEGTEEVPLTFEQETDAWAGLSDSDLEGWLADRGIRVRPGELTREQLIAKEIETKHLLAKKGLSGRLHFRICSG
jgi:hypothetical protein